VILVQHAPVDMGIIHSLPFFYWVVKARIDAQTVAERAGQIDRAALRAGCVTASSSALALTVTR